MAIPDDSESIEPQASRSDPQVSESDFVTEFIGPETVGWDRDLEVAATSMNFTLDTDLLVLDLPTANTNLPPSTDPSLLANRYKLGAEIGHGGMGVIFAGWDTLLDREVAIKVLLERLRENRSLIDRFLDEARITGRLQHAGIVSIHELGRLTDGRPFFVMKLVHGETLQQTLARRNNPKDEFEQLLFIFGKVCEAVAYSHTHEIIHRDLKPANIMVGEFGAVNVMDWGLAKVLGEDDVLESMMISETELPADEPDIIAPPVHFRLMKTEIGTIFGTPAYFAPEQARGEIDRVDKRADVFALGSILCEILTGKPPYTGNDLSEIFAKAVEADVAEPMERLEACSAPYQLIKLAQQCLSPEPSDRPSSAVEVADAVMDYLQSEQRRAERDLVRFFDLSVDLFGIADHQGRFERVNEKFTQVLGYSTEELTSRPFLDFVHPDDREQTMTQVEQMMLGQPAIQFLNRYRHADGHYLWLEWNARQVPEERAIYAVARDVTDRVALTEAHRRAEEGRLHLAEVVNSAEVAIISTNLNGIVQSWNPGATVLFGYTPEEVIGGTLDLLIPTGTDDQWLQAMSWMSQGGRPKFQEAYCRRKDGSLVPVSLTISPVRDSEGKIIGISKIARDISERKRTARQTATRYAISNILAESHNVEVAIPQILQAICEQLDWTLGQVFVVNREAQVLRCVHSWNAPECPMTEFMDLSIALEFQPGHGLPGRVWTARKSAWITEVRHDENFPRIQAAIQCDIQSAAAFPIIVEDEISGVIEVFSHRVRPEEADVLQLMTDLGNQIGQFIERKRAEEALQQSKLDTERANLELRERVRLLAMGQEIGSVLASKSSLKEMLQACTAAIVSHLGAAFARVWTLSEDGALLELQASAGLYTHTNGPHARVPVGQFKIGLIAQEGKPHLTNQVIGDPRVGDQEWATQEGLVAFAGYPLVVEGRLMGVVAMFSRLPLSEATLNAIGSAAKMIAASVSRKQTEDALLKSANETLQANRAALEERRLAEEANQNLAAIVESSEDAIIGMDLAGNIKSWNRAAEHLFGYPSEEMIGRPIIRLLATSSADEQEEILSKLRLGQRIEHFEMVQIHKDGRPIDVSVSISPICDKAGRVIGASQVARDITERKTAEAKLAQSQRELLDFAENANVSLHRVDGNGIIIWANQAELNFLGYSWNEYVGQPISKFHADAPVIEDILSRLIHGQTLTAYRARLIAKDGSIKTVSIYSSVFTENGEFKHTRCFTTEFHDPASAPQETPCHVSL